MTEIAVEPLADVNAFLAEWRGLFATLPNASVFQSPGWMETWLGGAPAGSALWRVRAEESGSACLLGVVGARSSRQPPVLGPRSAHLHEFGVSERDAIYVEYNDFLASPAAPLDLREHALGAVIDVAGPFDELVLRNARAELVAAAERLAAARNLGLRRLHVQPCFAVELDAVRAAGGEYLSSCSASLRSQLRRSLRLYEERGRVSLEVASSQPVRTGAWNSLKALHADGWGRRGQPGVFDNPAFTDFHERLVAKAPDLIELVVVRAGEQVIGCLYNLISGKRVYNYQSGFKFDDDNQLKPGMIAHALAAQHYLERGFSAYDFLAGDAQYKRRLGTETETLSTLVIETRGGVRAGLRKAIRSLRKGRATASGTRQTL